MSEERSIQHEHVVNHTGIFVAIFLMLCGLTGLSFWIANSHLMDNRMIGWCAMLSVSVAKALLVILFFMHLWWERAWKFVLTVPALIMGVLLVMLLVPDVGFRTESYSNERRSHAPEAQVEQQIGPTENATNSPE